MIAAAERRCSICRKTGHRRQTCPQAPRPVVDVVRDFDAAVYAARQRRDASQRGEPVNAEAADLLGVLLARLPAMVEDAARLERLRRDADGHLHAGHARAALVFALSQLRRVA